MVEVLEAQQEAVLVVAQEVQRHHPAIPYQALHSTLQRMEGQLLILSSWTLNQLRQ